MNGYKYQWNQLDKHNTNFYIEHLLFFIVIPFTLRSLGCISEKINSDKKTQALFDEKYSIEFL